MEDTAIIDLYFARDESAIGESEKKYGAYCRRIAGNILSVREDAEECVSDTWLTAWGRIPPVIPVSLRTFLGRITRDLSISRYRANHAQKRYSGLDVLLSELDECIPDRRSPEREVESRVLTETISRWLDSLPGDDRALFLRRYWYGDGLQTLAAETGCTAPQMAQRMLRLRKKLRRALEEEGVLP